MKILIVNDTKIPAFLYGGTERVIWDLGKELSKLGHEIYYLVKHGSECPFATVISIKEDIDILQQIPDFIDIVHFNFTPKNIEDFSKPYLITIHGNAGDDRIFNLNSVFVSKNHATNYGSNSFVHNGLDWDNYDKPELNSRKNHFHFLGKAAWRVKNVQGAIDIINNLKGEKLIVMGGNRFNFKMGIRLTFSPKVKFYGMIGGRAKSQLLNSSKGLIFPVRWHEPFGLAIIESLFYGAPVFGTPYGSLPELVPKELGFLSNKQWEIEAEMNNLDKYSPRQCHEYVLENFNSKKMAHAYLSKYEIVLSGLTLNEKTPQLQQIQTSKFLEWKSRP